ncbi:MAG: hypothetical protein HY456_02025 [Parcubacteria group bacterium]|nr:hypothetical protein [Parcubacteria group bacterium]
MNEGNTEKYRFGQFSLTPEEEAKIRKDAKDKGSDPDAEVEKARQQLAQATGRLHEAAGEEARREVEKGLEKDLG